MSPVTDPPPPPLVTRPGVYTISAATYHADALCAEPTFSRSIAKLLLTRSPRHAWWAHPRLNPDWQADDPSRFDLGKAAHRMLLGGAEAFRIVEAAEWRTKEAKAERAEALAAGELPVLRPQWETVEGMYEAALAQLRAHQEASDAFQAGLSERTLIWQEGDVWCRARLDWLPDSGSAFDDYKTTTNASPDAWGERVAFETGADLQAALYRRGIRAVLGIANPVFRFVVQEVEAPYALSVCQLSPGALDMADRKVDYALELWRWCRRNDRWPGYPARICHIDPAPWHERRWLEAETRRELAASQNDDLKTRMLDWQAPLTPAA